MTSGRLENLEDGLGVTSPGRLLLAELTSAGRGQSIKPRAAVVLRDSPACFDTARTLETVQCLVQRRVLDLDDTAGALSNPARDSVAMHLTPLEGAQHEDVERTLEEVERIGHAHSPYLVRGV